MIGQPMNKNTTHISRALSREQSAIHPVTFRFNKESLGMIKACSKSISVDSSKPLSNPATIRLLIDIHIDLDINQQSIPAKEMIHIRPDLKSWLNKDMSSQISLKITEAQRVAIRKLEFELQKLDWNTNIERNDTVQILVMNYGKLVLEQAEKESSNPPY